MDKVSLLALPAQPDQVSSLPHFPCLSCRKSLSSPPCPHLCNLTLLPPPPAVSLLLHLRRSFLPFIHEAVFPPRLPLLLPLVRLVANYQLYLGRFRSQDHHLRTTFYYHNNQLQSSSLVRHQCYNTLFTAGDETLLLTGRGRLVHFSK